MKFLTALFIVPFFLISCIQYKEVKFSGIENFKIQNFSTKDVTISFDVRIYNPNNYKIKVKPSEVEVLMGKSKVLGTAKVLNKITVDKGKTGSYPVTVEAKLSDVLISGGSSIIDLVTKRQTEINFRGNVKVKARGLGKRIQLDEKQSIDLSKFIKF